MLNIDRNAIDDILRRFEQVEEKVAKKALRTASRKAMNIVRQAAKDDAPVDSGDLKKHIDLRMRVKPGVIYARVGVRGGAKKNDGTPFYWRMVEFGTRNQPAQPFMIPALESNAEAVLDMVVEELKKALNQP